MPGTVLPGDPFIFDQAPTAQGFTYDPSTGTFTAINGGVYHFDIRINLDDGGTGAVPRQYYVQIEGDDVPRPSDTLLDCQIQNSGFEYPCSVSVIIDLPLPNTQFRLINESGITAYYGFDDGDPFANEMEMSIFQLD